jgi:hypothetical protein
MRPWDIESTFTRYSCYYSQMKFDKYELGYGICLACSLFLTYHFFTLGFVTALSGRQVIVWQHVLGFIGSLALVSVAIYLKLKSEKQ